MNTPTPETDGALQKAYDFEADWIHPDFARNLERERDDARKTCAEHHSIARKESKTCKVCGQATEMPFHTCGGRSGA